MNSPVSYMGNKPINDQLREYRFHEAAASLQKDENEEVNDGSKPFNMDLEPILI